MSIQIDHEKVSKKLALKIADLEYQLVVYSTVVEDMQTRIEQQENTIKTFEERDANNDNASTV